MYYVIGLVEDTPASIFPIEAQVAEKGIEPLTHGYGPCVLPLHYPAKKRKLKPSPLLVYLNLYCKLLIMYLIFVLSVFENI